MAIFIHTVLNSSIKILIMNLLLNFNFIIIIMFIKLN